ncbi:hypothetical protein Tco_1245168 [Tanacetum coccineum]
MSTAEAEYVSLSAFCAQVIWMRTQLLDYGYKYNRIPIYYDSKSAIAISCNPVQHSKTKHIDIRYHFIKEHVEKVIIMAQQQHAADVHPDELCPPNKRYDIMDANKKVDLEHFSWHTLKEERSKVGSVFMLDKKELTLTLDDFRQIFHLPQATANNHNSFVPPPSFSNMVPFYKKVLRFTMELKTQSNFKTIGLLQPWQTLCKIFSKCLITRVTGWDQPPLQIMKMLYCFVNNIHVDYAELLWEGLYYSLYHPTSSIPYPRFTKIIVSHYMTIFPEISRRPQDKYHNLQDDDIMKNIFNSGRHKDKVGMQIPAWLITKEMKHIEHYRIHLSAPGHLPNPNKEAAESSAPRRSTVICLGILERRSTRLTPPALVLNIDKADEMILQDTLQKSDKMVEGQENVVDDSSIPRNDESNIPGTRIESQSDKESPEVEITKEKEVDISKEKEVELTKEMEVEITQETPFISHKLSRQSTSILVLRYKPYSLPTISRFLSGGNMDVMVHCFMYIYKARFMPRKSFDTLSDNLHDVMVETLPAMVDKHIKNQVVKQVPEQVRNQERGNIQAQIKTHIDNAIANVIPSQVDASVRSYMSGHILHVHPAQSQTSYVPEQQYQMYLAMKDDPQLQQQDIAIWLALQMKFGRATVPQTACRTPVIRPRDQDEPHDDAHPKGENSAKGQKSSEYEAYVSGESSSGQVFQEEQAPSTSGNQEQNDDFDFWTDSYALDDDEIPLKQMADEMLRQRCTSGYEHQYHIDQMRNFLKSDIVWESRKEILVSSHSQKTTPLVHSYQRDPEAPALSLINQDLLIAMVFILSVFIRSSVIWERVHDFQLGIKSYQQKVNLTTPTITFPGIEEHEMFSIIYEPVHGIIYKNSKKEKWVMRHSEIHKFCDATLNRVLEGLKSYNNDVKYGYV